MGIIVYGILATALVGIWETAKRRGVWPWPFVGVALVGWHSFPIFGWILVGLTYLSIFLIGGWGRSRELSWQCPSCLDFNAPTTLICLCGHNPDEGHESKLAG